MTISGTLALGDLDTDLIFRNNTKGTHENAQETTVSVVLETGDDITIPKQPVLGGAGGNPLIYLQFAGNTGALSEEAFLGRCNKL